MFHCSVIKDHFRIAVCFKQLCYYIMLFSACQEVFSTFLKLFLFLSCSNFGSLSYLPLCCQELFSCNFSAFTERRRRDLNPRAATNDLLPFQGSPFNHLGTSALVDSHLAFCKIDIQFCTRNSSLWLRSTVSGESGIRTHAPLRTNGFQDRLVMTTSISLRIFDAFLCQRK